MLIASIRREIFRQQGDCSRSKFFWVFAYLAIKVWMNIRVQAALVGQRIERAVVKISSDAQRADVIACSQRLTNLLRFGFHQPLSMTLLAALAKK